MKIYVYTLEANGVIFYVGKTKNIKQRLYRHKNSAKLESSPKEKFINSILSNGGEISMSIIEESDKNNIDFWEIYWISQLKTWGFKLYNATCGGDGGDYWIGKTHSEETKEKLRKIRYDGIKRGKIYKLPGELNGRSKLTADQVIEMRKLRKEKGTTYGKLALKFGISKTIAIKIIKRERWKHI